MGGFHLFKRRSEENSGTQAISQENDDPLHPLLTSDLMHDDIYSFAMPTEAEIKDMGKSDWLAKSLILLQTLWFIIQCIARGIKHLPVTHLEIVILAYAAMNFVIYVFWWNKPLNVNWPVRVFRKSGESELSGMQPQSISVVRKLTWMSVFIGLERILDFITGIQDEGFNLSHEDRVPRFWANSTEDNATIADLVMLGVGICFGAIHCIAWVFPFLTHTELLIWRVSSVTITAVPIYIPLIFILANWMSDMHFKDTANIVGLSILPAGLLYIIACTVTLVLALTSLRDLPSEAFDTVHWTTFIPHI